MARRLIGIARAVLLVAWLVVFVVGIALAVGSRLAPAAGYELIIIRGGSMAPTIPSGSLVAVGQVDPALVRAGDVVTLRADNGVLITHRIMRTTTASGATYLETQGDANAAADPVLAPGRSIVGVVRAHVPLAGYLMAILSVPTGAVSLIGILATLLLASVLLDDLRGSTRGGGPTPVKAWREVSDGSPV